MSGPLPRVVGSLARTVCASLEFRESGEHAAAARAVAGCPFNSSMRPRFNPHRASEFEPAPSGSAVRCCANGRFQTIHPITGPPLKVQRLFPGLLLTLALQAGAAEVSGQMLLRDAHYWYDVPVDSLASNSFLGVGCDSLQVVLDVRDGHVDIATTDVESESAVEREDFVLYPDAITAEAQMFSYLLYGRS